MANSHPYAVGKQLSISLIKLGIVDDDDDYDDDEEITIKIVVTTHA